MAAVLPFRRGGLDGSHDACADDEPHLLVADEPMAGLDPSAQSGMVNLLQGRCREQSIISPSRG